MQRPPHLIAPEEVAAWLADSAVKTITVHCTDPASAHDIVEHGVDIGKSTADTGWGQGFYSSTIPRAQHGAIEVPVAVRLTRPLEILDSVRDASVLEDLTRQAGTENFRDAILAAGFDGVVVHFPEEIMVVAFYDEQVKVVLREGSHD